MGGGRKFSDRLRSAALRPATGELARQIGDRVKQADRNGSDTYDTVRRLDVIADQLLSKAEAGDLGAIALVADRIDGKATQHVDMQHKHAQPAVWVLSAGDTGAGMVSLAQGDSSPVLELPAGDYQSIPAQDDEKRPE